MGILTIMFFQSSEARLAEAGRHEKTCDCENEPRFQSGIYLPDAAVARFNLHWAVPERLGLPTRCGRGRSALRRANCQSITGGGCVKRRPAAHRHQKPTGRPLALL